MQKYLPNLFFSLYGNIRDINSQFLVIYDKKGTLLAVGADKSLLGKNFFSEDVQNFTNHNPILMNLTRIYCKVFQVMEYMIMEGVND